MGLSDIKRFFETGVRGFTSRHVDMLIWWIACSQIEGQTRRSSKTQLFRLSLRPVTNPLQAPGFDPRPWLKLAVGSVYVACLPPCSPRPSMSLSLAPDIPEPKLLLASLQNHPRCWLTKGCSDGAIPRDSPATSNGIRVTNVS